MGSIPRPETRPAESALSARVLGRLSKRRQHCPYCDDTGSVWMVCPDAGAVKVPCTCGRHEATPPVNLIDAGLVAGVVACCGVAYLLL